jgi:DedD protein
VERHVKERLIGAAVLVAAAVILIPEMLSGPDRSAPAAPDAAPASSGAMKTYSIDLSRSPSAAQSVPDQAPPPEALLPSESTIRQPLPDEAMPESLGGAEPEPVQSPERIVEVPSPSTLSPTVPAATARDDQKRPPSTEPAAQEKPAEVTKEAAKEASRVPAAGWVVQVGSFASQATAARLAKDLRAEGFESFVMPVKSAGATLYRVRVGPTPDRDAAHRALTRLKTRAPAAAVVRHP